MDWPEITKDTPLEEIKRIHQRIWQYVVENGEKPSDTGYQCNCVLCEYDIVISDVSNDNCDSCPVATDNRYRCLNGMYGLWDEAVCSGDIILAKSLAEKIRDIPFKYELEK